MDILEQYEVRFELITSIISDALENPNLNNTYVAYLFKELSGEIMVYERTGIQLIESKMQSLIDDEHSLKDVLLSPVETENGTFTVQQVIAGRLNA